MCPYDRTNPMKRTDPPVPPILYLGEQHVLYVGPTVAGRHRHHAVQVSVALTQSFRMRLADGAWQEYSSAIIPADLDHEFDSGGDVVANFFLEVEGADYQSVLEMEGHEGPGSDREFEVPDELLLALRLFHEGTSGVDTARTLCTHFVEALAGRRIRHRQVDARIGRVLEMIGEEPAEKIRVERLAAAVALSPSRLAHLFSEQVGVPIRRYRIWKAIREASRLCLTGTSLTEAAHTAGFTDSAHFSHCFRNLFGLNPALLLSRRTAVNVLLDAAPLQ